MVPIGTKILCQGWICSRTSGDTLFNIAHITAMCTQLDGIPATPGATTIERSSSPVWMNSKMRFTSPSVAKWPPFPLRIAGWPANII